MASSSDYDMLEKFLNNSLDIDFHTKTKQILEHDLAKYNFVYIDHDGGKYTTVVKYKCTCGHIITSSTIAPCSHLPRCLKTTEQFISKHLSNTNAIFLDLSINESKKNIVFYKCKCCEKMYEHDWNLLKSRLTVNYICDECETSSRKQNHTKLAGLSRRIPAKNIKSKLEKLLDIQQSICVPTS
jgi:hypothetical protein